MRVVEVFELGGWDGAVVFEEASVVEPGDLRKGWEKISGQPFDSRLLNTSLSALGRIRTCDARFRKPTLYPLSYEG